MKKIAVPSLIVLTFLLAGCESMQPQAPRSSLEIQAIQAKMFETDKSTAFKSVMSVFQDLGYVIQTASMETGVITAQSPTQQDGSSGAFLASMFANIRSEGRTYVTASLEDFSAKQTRIRLNFVDRRFRSGAYGQQATDEQPVYDAKIYQNAFEKISEAIFIRSSQK